MRGGEGVEEEGEGKKEMLSKPSCSLLGDGAHL